MKGGKEKGNRGEWKGEKEGEKERGGRKER